MGIAVEVGLSAAGGEVLLPAWVSGTSTHTWSPQLGGGVWYQRQGVLDAVAPVLSEYPRQPLVGLRNPYYDVGYRFDLNSWDAGSPEYAYWSERASQEYVLQTFGADAKYFWSMPTCNVHTTAVAGTPSGGNGYVWQKTEYYAAYLQYLIEDVTMTSGEYNALASTYDFYTDAGCGTVNTTSETAVGGNWANLRAKRGHPAPYSLEFVILGVEPYGDAQETIALGATYGALIETYRLAIRNRGGRLSSIPLGFCYYASGPPST